VAKKAALKSGKATFIERKGNGDVKGVFIVAPGRSFICKKGIVGPGEALKPEYIAGTDSERKASFDKLVANGFLVEKKAK